MDNLSDAEMLDRRRREAMALQTLNQTGFFARKEEELSWIDYLRVGESVVDSDIVLQLRARQAKLEFLQDLKFLAREAENQLAEGFES